MDYLKVYVEAVVISFPFLLGMAAMAMTLICFMKLFFEKPKPQLTNLMKSWVKGTLGGAVFISITLPLFALLTGR